MSVNVQSLIRLAEFFFTSPAARADEALASEAAQLFTFMKTYPRWKEFGAAASAAMAANGWTVTSDPATGAVVTVDPPYVAPAHQSPQDFNKNSSG